MGLTVGLEGITHFPKEPRDRDMARLESLPVQFRAKVPQAPAAPAEGRHGVAFDIGLDQGVERRHDLRVPFLDTFRPRPRPALAAGGQAGSGLIPPGQFLQPIVDR